MRVSCTGTSYQKRGNIYISSPKRWNMYISTPKRCNMYVSSQKNCNMSKGGHCHRAPVPGTAVAAPIPEQRQPPTPAQAPSLAPAPTRWARAPTPTSPSLSLHHLSYLVTIGRLRRRTLRRRWPSRRCRSTSTSMTWKTRQRKMCWLLHYAGVLTAHAKLALRSVQQHLE